MAGVEWTNEASLISVNIYVYIHVYSTGWIVFQNFQLFILPIDSRNWYNSLKPHLGILFISHLSLYELLQPQCCKSSTPSSRFFLGKEYSWFSRWGSCGKDPESDRRETKQHLESWRTQVYYTGGPRGASALKIWAQRSVATLLV